MGRVIRTFITSGGHGGERNLNVSAKAPHSGEGEAAGARMPARPLSSDTAAHTAKQGRNCWGLNDREKWLLLCQQHIKIQQAAESMAGQHPVSISALRPLGRKKWVWAPARKKRLAALVASQTLCLPHPLVGKTCIHPTVQVPTVPVLSALQGGFGVILLPFASSVHPLILASRQP